MLNNIYINNFRNLKDVTIKPSTITLLIGTNDSGKSGIFHSLMVLQQSFEHDNLADQLQFSGNLTNLGSWSEVVFEHDESNDIEIGIGGTFNASKFTHGAVNSDGTFSYKAISSVNKSSCEMTVSIDDFTFNVNGKVNDRILEAVIGNTQANCRILNDHGIGFNLDTSDDRARKYIRIVSTEFVANYLQKKSFCNLGYSILIVRYWDSTQN